MFTNCKSRLQQNVNVDIPIVSFNNKKKTIVLKTIVNKINFVFNNVKGFQATNKILKLFKYFKDKIVCSDFLFLRETHSTVNDAIK